MRVFISLSFAAVLSSTAFSQSASVSFDIADVHTSPRAAWAKTPANAMQGGYLLGNRYELHRATMLDLIRIAYGIDADKVYAGPSWLNYDKFEVIAKAPPGTRPEVLRQMLQSLLADRFKLVVKPESQPLPAYVLTVKDQTKLKPAASSNSEGCQGVPNPVREVPPANSLRCRGVTMDEFASGLRRLAVGYFSVPLINSTSLDGAWDIDLKYPPRGTSINVSTGETTQSSIDALPNAIEKQLGLKLELGKAPQPVLSVVSVNEQPAANPPGIETALPPLPPPQFEVASIRPCDGAERTQAPRVERGGRVTATCMPLLQLVLQAFSVAGPNPPVVAPKWLEGNPPSTRISIIAKAPEGAFPNNATEPAQTRDTLNAMLRALLEDRYKLAAHFEDRPVDAYTLVAVKPKMTKADPSERTGCSRQGELGATEKLVCRNLTMAQFVEELPGIAPEVRYPPLDETHLEGAWDFSLDFNFMLLLARSAASLRARNAPQAGTPPETEAAAPTGPATAIEAIEQQIGLKLETHKHPEPVLVIDHMEEKPTDN